MSTSTGELHLNKYLLVWSWLTSLPDEARPLFTMVFMNIRELINYVSKVLKETDTFHLVIPLSCLGDLLRDPVYEFPQVICIYVICDSTSDLQRIAPCFEYGFEKIKLWTISDLLASNSIDTNTKAIISLIESHISAQQPDMSIQRSQIRKQFASTSLHGFRVRNMAGFNQSFVCSSCELVCNEFFKLECRHQQCKICINIQKSCTICPQAIARNKVLLNHNLQMKMQDLTTHCSECSCILPLKDYETHLKQNHDELITPFIYNQQVDKNSTTISLNGTCIWEISNIEKLKNDAASSRPKSFFSPAFYLFPNGYKMCLRLYINGDCKGRDTHMSLFFVIMRGDHDDKLQWPFKFKATFSLIDQSITNDHQQHISQVCWPDPTAPCFDRPNSDMNNGFGIPMCFPLDFFQQNRNRYIYNDTIYIQIQIDPSTEKPTSSSMSGGGELPNDEEHVDTTDDDISASICFPDNFNNPQSSK